MCTNLIDFQHIIETQEQFDHMRKRKSHTVFDQLCFCRQAMIEIHIVWC